MGWIREEEGAYEHEGYNVGVLPDGTSPTYLIGDHTAVRHWWGVWSGPDEGAPTEPAVALRPTCECGWTGTDVPITPGAEFDEDDYDAATRDQWEAHVDQVVAGRRGRDTRHQAKSAADALTQGVHPVDALAALTDVQRYIERLTTKTVADAEASGASWSQIGGALGVAKQTAHRKYGKAGTPAPEEVAG